MSKKQTIYTKLENNALEEGSKLEKGELERVILEASNAYYNTDKPILSDLAFDTLLELLKDKYPKSTVLNQIGSQVPENVGNKVVLPHHLGSMDKIKPGSNHLRIWLQKYNSGPYCISEKLDGLSGLLEINYLKDIKANKEISSNFDMKLYTRGDGKVGHNISHLLPHINCFPDGIGKTKINNTKFLMRILNEMKTYKTNTISLRGEIIIRKDKFEKKYQDKYPKARSLVAGIVNSKPETIKRVKVQQTANDLDFVIYQVITPSKLSHFQQLTFCKDMGILVANNQQWFNETNDKLTSQRLQELLIAYKTKSNYDIDGIIIADDSKIHSIPTNGNPKYAVAFKMILDEQVKITTVSEVEYNVSKNGILKPRVKFESVKIGGDTIMFATGFNAKFIKDNKLGPGAKIKIIRSGDVIPYISEVLSPSKTGKWQEPSIPFHWNSTKVDAIAENVTELPEYQMKQLYQFFTVMDVDGLKQGTIERLMKGGFDTINLILKLEVENLLPIEGFQLKSATKLVDNIKNKVLNTPHSLYKVMNASNIFTNFGEKKLILITKNLAQEKILKTNLDELKISDITQIEGFSTKSGMQFLKKLGLFRKWLSEHPKLNVKLGNLENKEGDNSQQVAISKLNKDFLRKNVVITGFRDKDLERVLENTYRCKIQGGVRGNTNIVIAKDVDAKSSKLDKARELGIKLISYANAKKLLMS